MNEINTVIFDIGKVLVEFDWKKYLQRFNFPESINKEIGRIVFESPLWKERDRGLKTEKEYIEEFILEAPHLEKEIRKVFEQIVEVVEPYDFSGQWVKNIKEQGKKIYLLSNYSKDNFEHDIQKFEFYPYIDGEIISYREKHVKPEKEIYEALIEKYNIDPTEAVFLDDLQENLDGAAKFGIHTIHVTSHEKATKELLKYGIKSEI